MRDPMNLHFIVRLGVACVDTGPNASPPLCRLAALLLTKALLNNFNPFDADGGEGHFWKKYAQAHTVCWECGGGFKASSASNRGREKFHLVQAQMGWEQALKFMGNATDPLCWIAAALISQRLGDYHLAANTLGQMIHNFPQNPQFAYAAITASSILAELNQFEQAINYMHHAMVLGAPQPLSQLHLMFFMSRLHERWAAVPHDDADDALNPPHHAISQAQAGYNRCFEFEESKGGMMFKADWAVGGSDQWILANITWKKFGDAASAARLYVTAADFYAEGLRREPPKPMRAQPYLFLSRAYARAGKIEEAIESAETVIKIATKLAKSVKQEQMESYERNWEKLKHPSDIFEVELKLEMLNILDRYADAIPSASTLRQVSSAVVQERRRTELQLENKKLKRKSTVRWDFLRDRLKGAARKYFQMQLLNAPREAVSGAMLAKMGILCVDTGPHSSPQLDRCAALILQKAADTGYTGDPDVPNSAADFWLNFARAHFRIWTRDGIRAERIHLVRSSWAWEKALAHVKVACDVGCWRESSQVLMCLGDYARAAQTLGVLIRSFPRYPQIQAIQLDCAVMLFQLQRYEQAVAYAAAALKTNRPPAPLTHSDLLFFMARIYDKWAEESENQAEKQLEAREEAREAEKEARKLAKLEKEENPEDSSGSSEEEEEGESEEESSDEESIADFGEERREVAGKARMKIYENLKETYKLPFHEVFERGVDGEDGKVIKVVIDFEDWLKDPYLWRDFANRAIDANKYLIAVDLYQEAIRYATFDDEESVESSVESAKKEKRIKGKYEDSSSEEESTTTPNVYPNDGDNDGEEATQPFDLVSLWFGLARAHCRCGQMQQAVRACAKALKQPANEYTDRVANVMAHWQALSSNSIHSFDDEAVAPLPSLFDKYFKQQDETLQIDWSENTSTNNKSTSENSESAVVARYRKQLYTLTEGGEEAAEGIHTVEDVEKHMATKRRWMIIREALKAYARESLRKTLADGFLSIQGLERECGDELVVAIGQLGFACAAENGGGPNDTVTMAIGATLLLAKAHDYDYLDVVAKCNPDDKELATSSEARMLRARANAHWRVYEKQGMGSGKGELAHLDHSLTNWEGALKHMTVAGDTKNWCAYAAANTCKGKYDVAAQAYGTVLRSVGGNSSNVAIACASLLKALGSYDQAITYIFSALSMGLEPPYDNVDITFLIARIHEEQGVFAVESTAEAKRKEAKRQDRKTADLQKAQDAKSRKERRSQTNLDDELKNIMARKERRSSQANLEAAIDPEALVAEALADADEEEKKEGGEEEAGNDSARISRTAYTQVFNTMRDMDDDSFDDYETVDQWLADYKTWESHGDRCTSGGHHILAADLYEQAVLRLEKTEVHIDKSKLFLKFAKSLRKCGQMDRSLEAMEGAIVSEMDKAKKEKMSLLLKAWMASKESAGGDKRRKQRRTFSADGNVMWKISLMLPVTDIIEKFVPRPAPRVEDLELSKIRAVRELKQRNGKWRFLRRRLKDAARKEFAKIFVESVHSSIPKSKTRKILKGTLRDDELDELHSATAQGGYASTTRRASSLNALQLAARDEVTVALNMLVTMGKLCHDSSSSSSNLHRCAAVLLQRAVDSGYVGDGEFFRKLARSHFRAYLSAGVSGEREHLKLSNLAWDKAFEHLDNASKVDCWLDASQVRIHSGEFERAAQTLGVLVRSFPHYEGLSTVSLLASTILQHMGNFEQSRAYMYEAMQRGAPSPYTQIDLTFMMGRIYEQWGEDASVAEMSDSERQGLKKTAGNAYFAVYTNLKDTDSPLVMEGDSGIPMAFNVWVNSAATWRWFAEKASLGSNFLAAGMMYEQAIKRDTSLSGTNLRSILCFGLAKCLARYGNMQGARKWLHEALEGTDEYKITRRGSNVLPSANDSSQMQVILDAWENPTSKFDDEMAMPIPRLLAGYTLISPSAATTPAATPRTPRGDDVTPRRSSARGGGGMEGVGRGSMVSPRGPIEDLISTPVSMTATDKAEKEADEVAARVAKGRERWKLLKQKIKEAAVRKLCNEIDNALGLDVQKLAARIGFLLVTDKPEVSAAILQNLADRQFMGDKPGLFLEKLANAHTNAWFDSQGPGTTRLHLTYAKVAWDKALTHLAVASKPVSWAWTVSVCTALGEYGESSERLGTLTRSFPQIRNDPLAVIAMSASALLAELGHYDQACAYLYDSIEKGPPHPFTETDMSFYMARMTDRWGGGAKAQAAYESQGRKLEGGGKREEMSEMYDDDGHAVPLPGTEGCEEMIKRRRTAEVAYGNVFNQLKEFEARRGGGKKVRMMNADNHKEASSWLRDARSWQCYAEQANLANMPVMSCDLYKECCKRGNASKTMWAHLAKAQRQIGLMEECFESLRTSLTVKVGIAGNVDGQLHSNDQALGWLKFWESDEKQVTAFINGEVGGGEAVEGGETGEGDNVLRKRVKMKVKDLILEERKNIVIELDGGRGEGEEEGEGEEGRGERGSGFELKEVHVRVARWKINRRDKSRQLLFDWIKVGIKNASRKAVWERVVKSEQVEPSDGMKGEKSIDLAALGILCMNSGHNSLGRVCSILLERARLAGFDGNDGVAVGVTESGEKRESDCLGVMQVGMTTARFRRALATVHARLSDGPRIGQSYHALQSLKYSESSLKCEENVMRPQSWVDLVRAQIRCGSLEEAKDGLKSLLKLSGLGKEVRTFACLVSASVRLNERTEAGCAAAENDLRAGMTEGGCSGLLGRDLVFLSGFIAKKKADYLFARKCGLDGVATLVHEYDESSLVLFEAVMDEEKQAKMVKRGATKKMQKQQLDKEKEKEKAKVVTKSDEKKVIEFKSRADILAPIILNLKKWQTWTWYAKKCEGASQDLMASLLHEHAYRVASSDAAEKEGGQGRLTCGRNCIRALYRVGLGEEVVPFMNGLGKDEKKEMKEVCVVFGREKEYEEGLMKEVNEGDVLGKIEARYGVKSALPVYLPTKPEQFFNHWKLHDAQNERRWVILKQGMRPLARALVIQQVMTDVGNAENVAQLGVLCSAEKNPKGGRGGGTDRCACLLMQSAADLGYKGDAKFWRKLARIHLNLWHGSSHGQGGGGGERGHLEKADKAFTEALKHIENAVGVKTWLEAAEVKLCMGEYSAAAAILNRLLRGLGAGGIGNTKGVPDIERVTLTAVELMMELGKFQEAEGHLYDAITLGGEPGGRGVGNIDMLFYMARLHGNWGEQLMEDAGEDEARRAEGRAHLDTSEAAYSRVFRQCVEEGKGVGDAVVVEDWLGNWSSWSAFGERAAFARHYL